MRAFIAILYPADLRAELAQKASGLVATERDVRCMPAESLHLTLAFLGNVSSQSTDSIRSGMQAAASGRRPFVLDLGLGGTFPTGGEPRIAWTSVAGQLGDVEDLQMAITREMIGIGLRMDARPFSPHVTLARIGRQVTPTARSALARRFEQTDFGALGSHSVTSISLVESDLAPTGTVYREVLAVELDPTAQPAPPKPRRLGLFRRRR